MSHEERWKLPIEPRAIHKFDRYSALCNNWAFSAKVLEDLGNLCRTGLSENVETIAVAGSFGRLEGSIESDADYILVVKDDQHPSLDSDSAHLRKAVQSLGISLPNKSGVFSSPRSRSQLLSRIGHVDEAHDELGKRMLLLLESRPVYGVNQFEQLLNEVFKKYTEYIAGDPEKEFAFLTNDLMRYFRFICVNYQANFWRQNEAWALRNLKLRHSRIIMYAGLLFLLGEASKYSSTKKLDCVMERLPYTPLERIAWVYDENRDTGFFRILGLYNVFIARLSDTAWRAQLKDLEYADRYKIAAFAELKANSDALVAEFMRFIFARRGQWTDRFFEYLFF